MGKTTLTRKSCEPRIAHITANSIYDLSFAFMRLQEFYESPYSYIRGQRFSLEELIHAYTQREGDFTYLTDWGGFNIPGHIFHQFLALNTPLLQDERPLVSLVRPWLRSNAPFYVIGTLDDARIQNHELAHAYFYLDTKYRQEVTRALRTLPVRVRRSLRKGLLDLRYCKSVMLDETHAYLATSGLQELRKYFGQTVQKKHTQALSRIFRHRRKNKNPAGVSTSGV